jgi:hypothetical protein
VIAQFTQRGSVGVRVNDGIDHYGDPLSPLLFDIMAGILVILIAKGKEDGQLGSLIPHLVEGVICG